jgi:hypothetical protein
MELILIVVTLISLIVAIVMSVIAGRLIREDRRRSAARVEALSAEADFAESPLMPARPLARAVSVPTESPKPSVAELAIPAGLPRDPVPVSDAMFGTVQDSRGATVRPVAVLALCAVLAIVAGLAFLSTRDSDAPAAETRLVANTSDASLELLSLSHASSGAEWTISGLVRNPEASTEMTSVTVLAFLFDETGGFAGSGRAPLELGRIGPGESAPFSVSVAATGPVSRYRIGFRGADGRVIHHFDRRPSPPQQQARQ